MTAVGLVLVGGGVFFMLTGAIGLIRFPDFYTRMHAAGKCDTLGSLLVLTGLAWYGGVALFIFVTSPTATHAIARAAKRNDLAWWTREESR